jgi:diaminohydroxyphosphoribosylaminopyrimidine deaminase / 5-amino-6-(5-phosphoribosylamino)uracil reductase
MSPSEIKKTGSAEVYMQRCLQLADLGTGYTAPNPLVGAVLVHEGRIIGEGYHARYGGPHAEVNCVQSVGIMDRRLIPASTLYVSLEPCCHFGKTPPCTDLIIREKIPRVVIGCRDPFSKVNGKGIEILLAHGVIVEYPVLEDLSIEKNRRFFIFHLQNRPYIILKWAQSANYKMGGLTDHRIRISNEYSNRLVHKWRTEEAGILIGTNTALKDDPELTARLWPGKNPVRIVLDRELRLPDSLKIFDGNTPSIILNGKKESRSGDLHFKKIAAENAGIPPILSALYSSGILSVIVEGGAGLLQSFIDYGVWDEMRIITNQELEIPHGVSSPDFRNAKLLHSDIFGSDTVHYYRNTSMEESMGVWEYGSMGV